MGDASSPEIEPRSFDFIQRSDTIGEDHAEKGQTEDLPANREGSAKELASDVQGGTSSASFEPMSVQDGRSRITGGKSGHEGVSSTETMLNPVPEQNGNQTVIDNACIEVENKSFATPTEGQAPTGESSQQCKLKSDSTPEQHLKVKEVTDTPSTLVSSASEYKNEADFFGNELELKEKIDVEDRSADGSNFPSFGSSAKLPFQSNGKPEAMDNSSLHNQGHTDVNNFGLSEKPLNSAQETDDLEVSPIVDRVCLASNMMRTTLQPDNFDDVNILEDSKIPETCPPEAPMNIEPGKNICLNGDKINDHEEGIQKQGKVVNGSELSDLHDDGFLKLENDKKQSVLFGSSLESSHSTREAAVHPTVNESCLESRPDSEADKFEDLHCRANMEERRPSTISEEQSFSSGTWGWLDQGIPSSDPVPALVSNDMEGWHRFDIEEGNAINMVYGGGVLSQGSQQPELWEQLLEDGVEAGLEVKEKEEKISSLVPAGIESPVGDQNFQMGLASPGNPFIEGLDRLSNFSEAEGFVFNDTLPSSHFSPNINTAASLCSEEDSSNAANKKEGYLSGALHDFATTSGKQEIIAPELGKSDTTASGFVAPYGSESQTEANRNSFVGTTGSSVVPMELFEAPSFMSLVDPESDQLFKASMPTYDTKSNMSAQENGGDKWVANFDLMMPSQPQNLSSEEITRSISLPREDTGGVSAGKIQGIQSQSTSPSSKGRQAFSPSGIWNTFSRKNLTPTASPISKPSVSSPKLSPLVKKMVQKVRTTPAVGKQVLNTSSKVMSPKTEDNKSKRRPLWSCCGQFFK